MLKSKIVRETLKAKGCDHDEVETGKVTIGEDLSRLLEKLADDKPVVSETGIDSLEVTIPKRGQVTHGEDLMKNREPKSKEVVRTLVQRIPEEILRRRTIRRKIVSFKEEDEHLGLDQESGVWPKPEKDGEEKNFPGELEERDDG